MKDAGYETQSIDIRSLDDLESGDGAPLELSVADVSSRRRRRRLSPHARLLIGVMALAALAVLGTRLAGALLAAGAVG